MMGFLIFLTSVCAAAVFGTLRDTFGLPVPDALGWVTLAAMGVGVVLGLVRNAVR